MGDENCKPVWSNQSAKQVPISKKIGEWGETKVKFKTMHREQKYLVNIHLKTQSIMVIQTSVSVND